MSIISPSRRWFSHPVKESIRFGVELEFRSLLRKFPNDDLFGWVWGFDESVFYSYTEEEENRLYRRGWRSVELKSPIFFLNKDLNSFKSDLDKILQIFRSYSVVTRSSGLHVHMSSNDYGVCVDADKMEDYFREKYASKVWTDREQYCLKFDHWSRYRPVHVVEDDNHIEVRIFNGTLSPNKIVKNVLETAKIYLQNCSNDSIDK